MAKLSERVVYSDEVIGRALEEAADILLKESRNKYLLRTNEENTMTNTLRELTVTLIDNNPHLEDDQRIIFQKKGISTTASYDDVKLDLIATGEVMPALKKHNEGVRSKAVREDILENTGREVYLKAIKKLSDPQLEWRFVATA